MSSRKSAVSLFAVGIFLFTMAAAPCAWADGTCTAFLAAEFREAQAKNQVYKIELFMHREDSKLVTYSAGFLGPNANDGGFTGRANQLFSDRQVGNQPFNINAADQLDLRLSASGVLSIHYKPWNFDTTWDLSCTGSMLTKYLPGFGVVTLTFRDLFALSSGGVVTNLNNNARTGEYFDTSLSPSTVNAGTLRTFGKLATLKLKGQIYAQPLYVRGLTLPDGTVHNIVYAATQENVVHAFDTNSFAQLWSASLGPAVPASEVDCQNNISPLVGITSTPVISLERSTIYVVAKSKEAGRYFYRLHALDLATGSELSGSPIEISATVPGTGDASRNGFISFNAKVQLNRPGLLLSDGTIYIAFGSHGDCNSDSYHGWVFGYDANTLSQVGVFIATPTGDTGGIWQAGRGLVSDQAGNVYFMTGNGTVDFGGPSKNLGESVVKLDQKMNLKDWFTPGPKSDAQDPNDYRCLNSADLDLGSSGPLLLPPSMGGGTQFVLGGGKGGMLYLLNSTSLGGSDHFHEADMKVATHWPEWFGLACHAQVKTGGTDTHHIHSGPVLDPITSILYLFGENDQLKAFTVRNGRIVGPLAISKYRAPSGMPGGALSLSHSDQPNSELVWALLPLKDDANSQIVEGMLAVFDATPAPCVGGGCTPNVLDLRLLWHSKMDARDDVGLYAKFAPVTIADGKAFVPSFGDPSTCGPYPKKHIDQNCEHPGWLLIYGLINPPRD
jgi:hypothetical protein